MARDAVVHIVSAGTQFSSAQLMGAGTRTLHSSKRPPLSLAAFGIELLSPLHSTDTISQNKTSPYALTSTRVERTENRPRSCRVTHGDNHPPDSSVELACGSTGYWCRSRPTAFRRQCTGESGAG